ncbi:MAG: helix-turn-helix domain-containing protein [Bacteroidales bacterium]|nr:helix-turn-helix domain-containing protein [Bacteroidales bacterium]
METVINQDLQLAFDFVQFTNRNIFLTGKAGTGKTTFLHSLRKKSPKRMIVVAPTGVAAINAGGVTIHSFFQLPFHPHVPSQYIRVDSLHQPTPSESGSYKLSREKVNIIKSLDLIVIDEISMVRADLLDAVDGILRRHKDHDRPFGGIQLLMIGDLQQLAPVVKDEDREILDRYYDTTFFFGSLALRSTDYVTIELRHIYRQQDKQFINLLNQIRDNRLDTPSQTLLNSRYNPHFSKGSEEGYITLTTHNSQAQAINNTKLEQLPGKVHSFKAIIKDDFPEYAYPTAQELLLKTGAQVMFVKNDISRDKLFYNGKIGKVTGFDDDAIIVECPGDDAPIQVEMAEWQNMKYSLNEESKEIEETEIGTFVQYPLKLAWAITIHKSQGLTFDKVIIDARAAFAHGQVYVALSRCRTLEGIVLSSQINQHGIISDATVSGFVREAEQNQPDRNILASARQEYQQMLLMSLFDFTSILKSIHYCLKIYDSHQESIAGNLKPVLEAASGAVKADLIDVSGKFYPQLRHFLSLQEDAETNTQLQERLNKACCYFSEKTSAAMLGVLEGITLEIDNKAVRKSITGALEKLKQEVLIKIVCLDSVKDGFRVQEYLETKAKTAIELPAQKTRQVKIVEEPAGEIIHPDLYRRIKAWRDQKAMEANLAHYMVIQQATMVTLSGFLPRSESDLKKIKGMGKKKIEKYGTEILQMIETYCNERDIGETPVIAPRYVPVEKKPKVDSRAQSLDLFRSGKSADQIARERMMAVTTIEGHLAHYVGLGLLSVDELVAPDVVELITDQIQEQPDNTLRPIKDALGDRVSWSEIKYVLKHMEYLRNNPQ